MNLQLAIAALLGADVMKVLNPQSPQARAIFNLGIVTATVLAVIFAVVIGIVVYVLLRFPRWREGEREPEPGGRQHTHRNCVDGDPVRHRLRPLCARGADHGHLGPVAAAESRHCRNRSSMQIETSNVQEPELVTAA